MFWMKQFLKSAYQLFTIILQNMCLCMTLYSPWWLFMWRRYSLSCVNFLPQCSHSLSKFSFTLPFFPWVAFLTCRLNRAFSKNSFPHTLHLPKGQNTQFSLKSTSNKCSSLSRVQVLYNTEYNFHDRLYSDLRLCFSFSLKTKSLIINKIIIK